MGPSNKILFILSSVCLFGGFLIIFANKTDPSWLIFLLAAFFGALGAVNGQALRNILFNVRKGKFRVELATPEQIEKSIEVSKERPKLSASEISIITSNSQVIPDQRRTDADYLVLSMAARRENDPDRALQYAYSGLSKPSSNKPMKANLIHRVAYELGEFGLKEKALEYYNEAIAIDPTFAPPHNNRAILLKEMNRDEEALAAYGEAIRLEPKDAEIRSNRGDLLEKMNLTDEALADYSHAIQLDPGYANAYSNRGRLLLKMDCYKDALADLDKAVLLDPNKLSAVNNRGIALLKMDRDEEALAAFDEAIRLDPEYANGYDSRGDVLKKMGRYDDALAAYDEAIRLDPTFTTAHKNRALLLEGMG